MKFSAIAKGTRATKLVQFRLANAPQPPPLTAEQVEAGVSVISDPGLVKCLVRVLTGAEQEEIFHRAQQDAAAKGVAEWNGDHPICRLRQMVRTIELSVMDADAPEQLFFASAEQILASPELGTDNIALLYEAQDDWQQEQSFGSGGKTMTLDQVIGILAKEAERPENSAEATPYDSLRPGMRKQFVRTTANLLFACLRPNSDSGSTTDFDTKNGSKKTRRQRSAD